MVHSHHKHGASAEGA
jgi:hypothetical protein